MASSGFLALFDDIATLLDDIAVMAKAATKKTAGVLGDDLALNAEQVSGFAASRELPVVWAVFKGSIINKVILVPLALAISYFAPWLITPLLMIGGAYLCFEGFEKVMHKFFHKEDENHHKEVLKTAAKDVKVNMLEYEKVKIKGAIRTDFILSAEIVAIALGVVSDAPFIKQVVILSLVAFLVTFAVYGLVGAIVKIDDVGMWLHKKSSIVAKKVGMFLINSMPYIMKTLTFVGTIAMFLVGGGIIMHGLPFIHHTTDSIVHANSFMEAVAPTVISLIIGFIVGGIVLAVVNGFEKIFHKKETV